MERAGSEERAESAGAAKDCDGLTCRKKPNPWAGGRALGAEERADLRKHPNVEELLSEKLR